MIDDYRVLKFVSRCEHEFNTGRLQTKVIKDDFALKPTRACYFDVRNNTDEIFEKINYLI